MKYGEKGKTMSNYKKASHNIKKKILKNTNKNTDIQIGHSE